MMRMEEFEKSIKDLVSEKMGFHATVVEATGMNGIAHRSLLIDNGTNVSPCIDLNQLLRFLEEGGNDVEEVMTQLCCQITESNKLSNHIRPWIESSLSKEYMLQNCHFQILNAQRNRELLCEAVSAPFFDLAGIVKVRVHQGSYEFSYTVTEPLCQALHMTKEELLSAAMVNLEKTSFQIVRVEDFTGDPYIEDEKNALFVATNEQALNGASILLYPDKIFGLAEKMGMDLYILPSSIHEVLLISERCGRAEEELRDLVHAVNTSALKETDYLSDSIYKTDIRHKTIYICEPPM